MNLTKLLGVSRAFRAGAPLGDVAVMKVDALAERPAGISERLRHVHGYAPEQDVAERRRLPSGTLGREYS